jgi:hypothetical protein
MSNEQPIQWFENPTYMEKDDRFSRLEEQLAELVKAVQQLTRELGMAGLAAKVTVMDDKIANCRMGSEQKAQRGELHNSLNVQDKIEAAVPKPVQRSEWRENGNLGTLGDKGPLPACTVDSLIAVVVKAPEVTVEKDTQIDRGGKEYLLVFNAKMSATPPANFGKGSTKGPGPGPGTIAESGVRFQVIRVSYANDMAGRVVVEQFEWVGVG